MSQANKSLELSGFGTLIGTPDQVRESLDHLGVEHVIALNRTILTDE